jgi:hypothetical protein
MPWAEGPLVQLSNGTSFPSQLTVGVEVGDGQLLTLTLQVEGGRPVLTRCLVERAPEAVPLSASALHDLPLGEIVDRVVESIGAFTYMRAQQGAQEGEFAWSDFWRAGAGASSSLRGRPVGDEALAVVAEIVQANTFNPRKEISKRLHVSARTASRWIRLAQDRGLIPVAPKETGDKQ